jgi:hypothetical protein
VRQQEAVSSTRATTMEATIKAVASHLSMRTTVDLNNANHVAVRLIRLLWPSTQKFVKKCSLKSVKRSTSKNTARRPTRTARVLKMINSEEESHRHENQSLQRSKCQRVTCQSGRFRACSSEQRWVQTVVEVEAPQISILPMRQASRLTTELIVSGVVASSTRWQATVTSPCAKRSTKRT